jgi:hypothetical protein
MPSYDAECAVHGIVEVVARMRDRLYCPRCGREVEKRFLVCQGARIDDMINVGAGRRDSTAGVNLGLPGVTDKDGEYRGITGNELGSNRRAKERAKAHDLTPLDGGRYRSTA